MNTLSIVVGACIITASFSWMLGNQYGWKKGWEDGLSVGNLYKNLYTKEIKRSALLIEIINTYENLLGFYKKNR